MVLGYLQNHAVYLVLITLRVKECLPAQLVAHGITVVNLNRINAKSYTTKDWNL